MFRLQALFDQNMRILDNLNDAVIIVVIQDCERLIFRAILHHQMHLVHQYILDNEVADLVRAERLSANLQLAAHLCGELSDVVEDFHGLIRLLELLGCPDRKSVV